MENLEKKKRLKIGELRYMYTGILVKRAWSHDWVCTDPYGVSNTNR